MENTKLLSAIKANRFLRTGSEIGILFFMVNFVVAIVELIGDATNPGAATTSESLYPPWLFILMLVSFVISSVFIIIGLVIFYKTHEPENKRKLYGYPMMVGLFTLLIIARYVAILLFLFYPMTWGIFIVGALYDNNILQVYMSETILNAIITSITVLLSIFSLLLFGTLFKELKLWYNTNASSFLVSIIINGVALAVYLTSIILGKLLFVSPFASETVHMTTYFLYLVALALIEFAFFANYLELSFKFIYSRPEKVKTLKEEEQL